MPTVRVRERPAQRRIVAVVLDRHAAGVRLGDWAQWGISPRIEMRAP
jgi:hypothetical protein